MQRALLERVDRSLRRRKVLLTPRATTAGSPSATTGEAMADRVTRKGGRGSGHNASLVAALALESPYRAAATVWSRYRPMPMVVPAVAKRAPEQAPTSRARHTLPRPRIAVPAALVAIIGIVVVAGLCWALLVPPWQSPDENAQFAYAQSIAERFALPGDAHRPGWSADQSLADDDVNANALAFRSSVVRPNWTARDFKAYQYEVAHSDVPRDNGGGPNPAASNPPLYYVYADLAYWATYWGNAFDRLYAMRIWGISLLVLAAVGGWLLAGEVLGRRRLPQLACAAAIGLFPMETFMATAVNPDGLQVALWTFAFWLGARVILRAARPRDVLSLSAVTAAAILTKGTSYALLPALLVALLIGWLKRPRGQRIDLGLPYSVAGLVVTVPILVWLEVSKATGIAAVNAASSAAGRVSPSRSRSTSSWLTCGSSTCPGSLSWALIERPLDCRLQHLDTTGWGTFGWLEFRHADLGVHSARQCDRCHRSHKRGDPGPPFAGGRGVGSSSPSSP